VRWVLFALAGLAVAVAVGIVASRVTSQRIGLASEPLSAGENLAPHPGAARGGRGGSHGPGSGDGGGDQSSTTTATTAAPPSSSSTVTTAPTTTSTGTTAADDSKPSDDSADSDD
jgi:hypothetical protein